jgi:5-methylcytosine-specific restriction protein B
MKNDNNINPDLDVEDLMIGHSYFLCETEDDLKRRLEYEIIPLLWEYQKDGILTCDRQTLKGKVSEWQNL